MRATASVTGSPFPMVITGRVMISSATVWTSITYLNRFLSRVRNLIADGRVRRMLTHGHPYWVHGAPASGNRATEGAV
jgi:hypothetical protein